MTATVTELPKSSTGRKAGDVGQAALSVLSASDPLEQETITIGERQYTIQELTALRMLELGSLIMSEIQSLADAGLLTGDAWGGVKASDLTTILPRIAMVWQRVPGLFGRFLALLLSAEATDDPEYILKYIKLRQLTAVILGFMRANEWGDLIADFFRIKAEFQQTVARLQESISKLDTSSQS